VLLVGDWAQLSPVATGGAFALLVKDRGDAPELLDVRRFAHVWERAASLGLRNGRVGVIDTYDSNGRISGGDREAMLDALYAAWHGDIAAGRGSLMIADDNFTVGDLNARARADRVATGQVQDGGLELADGVTAGVGDLVGSRWVVAATKAWAVSTVWPWARWAVVAYPSSTSWPPAAAKATGCTSTPLKTPILRWSMVAQTTSTASTCYDACSPLRASRSRPPRRSRTSGPTPTQPARSPPSTSRSRGPSSTAAAPPSTTLTWSAHWPAEPS